MNRTILSITVSTCLLLAGAIAGAGERQSLATVDVNGSSRIDCTPPNDLAACTAWHQEIRRNFTGCEIGMLFGAATPHAEYLTSYPRVKARFERLKGEFAADHAASHSVAAR